MISRTLARCAIAGVLLIAACGPPAANSTASPIATAKAVGTATLSDKDCTFDAASRLPAGLLVFKLVNTTRLPSRFIWIKLKEGHTFKDLDDLQKSGITEKPEWVEDAAVVDVPPSVSGKMEAPTLDGVNYAFHCGIVNPDGSVTAFWKGPFQGVKQP
jgi:hypothetical protein